MEFSLQAAVSLSRSSRAMARTGLRMMPTSPSPPLKFRTAGFPQYGFKASMSDRAFLENSMVKPAPGVPTQLPSLPLSFARLPLKGRPGSVSRSGQGSTCRCSGGVPPFPRGPWLRSELCCLGPSSLSTTPSASPAGTLRFRFYAYTQRLRCAGAPRRPAGPSLLSLLFFPSVPSTLPRGSAASTIPFSQSAVPGFLDLAASRHPPTPRLCQQYPTGVLFRGCIVRFILRPACLSSPPDWLRQDEVICSSPCLLRYIVTPAFDAVRYRTTLGVRLNGRTGNLPLLGLSPNQYQQLVRLHAKA